MRILLTGPPGAGKSTWAENANIQVFDDGVDWKTRLEMANRFRGPCVLVVSAPKAITKEMYSKKFEGITDMITLMPPMMETVRRMEGRHNKNRLHQEVQRWYLDYSKHPMEVVYENTD